jgi:hypothetical protein
VEAAIATTGDDHGFAHHLTHQMVPGFGNLLTPTHAEPLALEDPILLQCEPLGRHIPIAGQCGYHPTRLPDPPNAER